MIQREPIPSTDRAAMPLVLVVGSAAQQALGSIAPAAKALQLRVVPLADVAAAIVWLAVERIEPALVVLCQSWPGEVSDREVMALRRAGPLARLCAIAGSWCEGETRSGRPWPGVWRVYAHQWPQRCGRELAALAAGRPTVWNLPATATAEEQLLAEMDLVARRSADGVGDIARPGTVAVLAASAEAGSALGDACRSLGYEAGVWRALPESLECRPGVLLWDTSAERAACPTRVARMSAIVGGAPIVALVGFPRPEEIERARQAGVAAVLSKPFLVADLAWQLAALSG